MVHIGRQITFFNVLLWAFEKVSKNSLKSEVIIIEFVDLRRHIVE